MPIVAYVDCFSGASGDMLLGALLDAGLSMDVLCEDIGRLRLTGVRLERARQTSRGITGTRFSVVDELRDRTLRNLSSIRDIVTASDLPDQVKLRSMDVFTLLADSEARIHGVPIEQVHFHEVGAVDTIVDVVGFCAALTRLEVDALYCSALPTGGGTIVTQHGLLPVPAPATLALLANAGAVLVPSEARGEMVTPTGAAILAALARFEQPALRLRSVGYGFGAKEFPWANFVRVWIGDEVNASATRIGPTQDAPLPPHLHSHVGDHGHAHAHHDGHASEAPDEPCPA